MGSSVGNHPRCSRQKPAHRQNELVPIFFARSCGFRNAQPLSHRGSAATWYKSQCSALRPWEPQLNKSCRPRLGCLEPERHQPSCGGVAEFRSRAGSLEHDARRQVRASSRSHRCRVSQPSTERRGAGSRQGSWRSDGNARLSRAGTREQASTPGRSSGLTWRRAGSSRPIPSDPLSCCDS